MQFSKTFILKLQNGTMTVKHLAGHRRSGNWLKRLSDDCRQMENAIGQSSHLGQAAQEDPQEVFVEGEAGEESSRWQATDIHSPIFFFALPRLPVKAHFYFSGTLSFLILYREYKCSEYNVMISSIFDKTRHARQTRIFCKQKYKRIDSRYISYT
jgi:hypothetical protein